MRLGLLVGECGTMDTPHVVPESKEAYIKPLIVSCDLPGPNETPPARPCEAPLFASDNLKNTPCEPLPDPIVLGCFTMATNHGAFGNNPCLTVGSFPCPYPAFGEMTRPARLVFWYLDRIECSRFIE